MATETDEKPDALEQYECAANTSNLKCEARTRGAVDYLIAGGWGESRLGMALIRLHSAYDSSEKPERRQALPIKEWKKIVKGEEAARRAHAEQHQRFEAWYRAEVERLLGRLQAFPSVREQLTIQATKWGMGRSGDPITRAELSEERENDDAMLAKHQALVATAADEDEKRQAQATLDYWTRAVEKRRRAEWAEEFDRASVKAVATIRYWLAQQCSACHGTRWQLIPGTNRQSDRMCPVCEQNKMSGYAPPPYQQEGRRLANYLDKCLQAAHTSLRRNLSNTRISRQEREELAAQEKPDERA